MCFSAKASFITSALLSLIGIFTIKEVKDRSQLLFASIPILFAIQQFSEGLIWHFKDKFSEISYLIKFFSYIFLTFALIIWPIVIPLSLLSLEKNLETKKRLKAILLLGIIWAIAFILILFNENVIVNTELLHIYYKVNIPFDFDYKTALITYCITTIVPFFISKQKSVKIFGLLLLISCLISYYYWYNFLTSVWCFFAALLSTFVYLIIKWNNLRNYYIKALSKHL